MKNYPLFAFVMIILLAGCQQSNSNGGGAEPAQLIPANTDRSITPKFELQRIDARTLEITISSVSASTNIRQVTRFSNLEGQAKTFEPTSPSKFTETLYSAENDLRPWTYAYTVSTPSGDFIFKVNELKDLILTNQKRLSEFIFSSSNIKLRKFILGPEADLITSGQNISFTTEVLEAAGGSKIQTLSEEEALTPAPLQTPGKSGGNLFLIATQVKGRLVVNLRGGKGGKGTKGIDIPSDDRGATGSSGANSKSYLSRPRGGFHGDLTGGLDSYCISQAQDGGKGGKGKTGGAGSPGFDGGNSGAFNFRFKESQNFSIAINSIPGLAGDGGDGGAGGPGGLGGEPGQHSLECTKPAKRGPEGDRGDQGATGPSGDYGDIDSVCIENTGEPTCFKKSKVKLEF